MRIVTFKSVLDAVLRRLGLDPDAETTTHDTVRAIAQHLQNRVRSGWDYYDWPELTVIEERALRSLWRPGTVYSKGDEVFYFANRTYYLAKGTTTAGETPDASSDWTQTTIADRYISRNQAGELAIGEVRGIYGTDPRKTCARSINFRPSEEGIDLAGTPGATGTVWIKFQRRAPLFSAVPFAPGRAYKRGNVVFDSESGNCFRALAANTDTNVLAQSRWILQPFPFLLERYATAGAFADALRELDQASLNPDLIVARLRLSAVAESEAETALQREMDLLSAQGDRPIYPPFGTHGESYGGRSLVAHLPVIFP